MLTLLFIIQLSSSVFHGKQINTSQVSMSLLELSNKYYTSSCEILFCGHEHRL
jgi:predicted phosphodiesterase